MMEGPNDPNSPDDVPGEEPSVGSLPANDELEAALREATESVDARAAAGAEGGGGDPGGIDKVTIEALSQELRALTEQHTTALAELEELKGLQDKYVRLQADFENVRRRGLKERQESANFGHQNLVKDLLPAVDNLERAVSHAEESEAGNLESLLQGVDLVLKELLGALAKHGLSGIEAEGQTFDPEVHEAMAQVPDPNASPNSVVEVLQKGYMLRNRMLRPARVVVSKAPEEVVPGDGES